MLTRVLSTVLVVAALPATRSAAAQVRKAVDAPIAFPQCGGAAWDDYQVEELVHFRPDSALGIAPTDTAGGSLVAQFVVDSMGHVVPESFYAMTPSTVALKEQIVAWLPKWRYAPARLGGRATCQIV